MVRCGKSTCTLCSNGPAHGPYWYAHWRDEAGRLHGTYCGKVHAVDATGARPAEVYSFGSMGHLTIRLLGGLEIRRGRRKLDAQRWGPESPRRLIALLALRPAGVHREEAAELLWPSEGPGVAAARVNAALSHARSALTVLAPERDPSPSGLRYLPRRETVLRLHLARIDCIDAQVCLAKTLDPGTEVAGLERVLALYGGELLPEFRYETWTDV